MGLFNLRWNNHVSNVLQMFIEHYSSESFVDVTLSCEGRFIKAHKMILSACSPYFQELFLNHDAKHPMIIFYGMKYDDLQSIISFMYNGEIEVEESDLGDLLAVAETLQVKGLCNMRDNNEITNTQAQNLEQQQHQKQKKNDKTIDPVIPSLKNLKKREMIPDLSDIEEEKINSSSKKKVCFERNKNESRQVDDQALYQNDIEEIKEPKKNIEKKKTKTNQPKIISDTNFTEKIRRPPNAFMVFANEWRRKLAFKYPGNSNTEISVRLGVMWKSLDDESKTSYYALAKQLNEEHKKKYPGYFYSPKEARMRKHLRQDLMLGR
ncbi:protein tramtrack, alpha isoform-like isoform X2 [Aphidius gifuensis]|nr:protein tramtrack, alpha isoform-like isoform X2 [Aphidius gifuensis]